MKRFGLLISAVLVMTGAAEAAPRSQQGAAPIDQDYVTGYVGIFDVLKTSQDTVQVGGEYRFRQWDFGVRPTLGLNVDFDGGGYFYGGINWEVPLGTSNFILIPNFMIGLYHEGNSKPLGGPLEFRSGIELDYQLPSTHRIGIAFNHISNASIYNHNPGAETLLINYSVPVSVFGR